MRLRLEPVPEFPGGHVDAQHTGRRPLGRLRQTQGVTNASGTLRVAYTPSHIAGYVKVIATIEGADLGAVVKVQVPDLHQLGGGLGGGENYNLIGADAPHPDNHYGTLAANIGLVEIANDYMYEYYSDNPIPDADKLAYNDQSLVFGGKFDLRRRNEAMPGWSDGVSHHEHREGINCDVRSNNVPNARRARLNQIFFNRGSTRTNDETASDAPHWHLRFEFNNQQAAIGRNTGNFVESSIWGSLGREANYAEWQDWTNKLTNAQAQGQATMLADTRGYVRSLFKSTEYVNRNQTDADYVTDLYWGYLLREPDPGGYNTWINALQNHNAQGLDGRELVLQGFEYSTEFANLVAALERVPEEPPPPSPPPCTDNDGDGYCSGQDCNDYDSSVYPGAGTYCSSGEDRNCNGQDDYSECYGCGVYGCY